MLLENTKRRIETDLRTKIAETSLKAEAGDLEGAIKRSESLKADNINRIFSAEIFSGKPSDRIKRFVDSENSKGRKVSAGYYKPDLSRVSAVRTEIENLVFNCGIDGLYFDLTGVADESAANAFLETVLENVGPDVRIDVLSSGINFTDSVRNRVRPINLIRIDSPETWVFEASAVYELEIPENTSADCLVNIDRIPSNVRLILREKEMRYASEKILGIIDARSFMGRLLRSIRVAPPTGEEAVQYERNWVNNLDRNDVMESEISVATELLSAISEGGPESVEKLVQVCGKSSVIGLHIAELNRENTPDAVKLAFAKELVARALAENAMAEKEGFSFEFASPEARQKMGALILGQRVKPELRGIRATDQQISAAKLEVSELIKKYEQAHPILEHISSKYPEGNYPAVCRLVSDNIEIIARSNSAGNPAAAADIMIELLKSYSDPKLKVRAEKRETPFNIKAILASQQAA